jgi:hypothetical protein
VCFFDSAIISSPVIGFFAVSIAIPAFFPKFRAHAH